MASGLAPERQDEIAEAVDRGRSDVEALCALDEAKDLDPRLHPVEVAELPLERRKHRQSGRSRGVIAPLDGQLGADPAPEKLPVAVERAVTRDVCQLPVQTHRFIGQPHARRRRERRRKLQTHLHQAILDHTHGHSLPDMGTATAVARMRSRAVFDGVRVHRPGRSPETSRPARDGQGAVLRVVERTLNDDVAARWEGRPAALARLAGHDADAVALVVPMRRASVRSTASLAKVSARRRPAPRYAWSHPLWRSMTVTTAAHSTLPAAREAVGQAFS